MSAPMPDAHPRHTATPDADRCSIPSGTTIVDQPESPHLYISRRWYEVATSRTLGSLGCLDTRITHTPGSMSPTSNSLSPKLMVARAKELLSQRSSRMPKTPEGGKAHGASCRTKSVVKSLRHGSREIVAEKSRDWLRLGYYSVSEERLFDGFDGEAEDPEISIVSDTPRIAPLRPTSKLLPDLTIIIPQNNIASEFFVEHNSINAGVEADGESSSDESLHVAPLYLQSSPITSVSKDGDTTAETSFYTAGSETSFHYTPATKEDDDVFAAETSHTQRPMTNYTAKLYDAMVPDRGYKTPSIASTTSSTEPLVDTPSPSRKLRHTALKSPRETRSGSLRAQFSKAEPASLALAEGVPKMWQLNHMESTRDLRVAPSLEQGLRDDSLKVFEDYATAEAAAIVHVEPDVVDIRRTQTFKKLESRNPDVSDQRQCDRDMEIAPLNIAPKPRPVRSSSGIVLEYDVATMPTEILYTIVFSAAYGDANCSELASGLYGALPESGSPITECVWDGRKQRLLLQSHLLEELKNLKQCGLMRDDVFAVIRDQFFPTSVTNVLSSEDFARYIRRAVNRFKLAEERAEEVLGLVINDEDQGFAQTSPEDEEFFEREPFNSQGFVYDNGSSDEHYGRLGSLPSTVGSFEGWESEPEPRVSWYSLFFTKVTRMFSIGHRKPMA
ncbi:uncharacterized protein M421DRAFT_421400 [Didymella exigua CBS 183.55]|uniref:Uncharacterized protein n=1 Tax=Didymella exigua CBS 183.55 TaxID=1150837 RepID=A0A6A5RGV7_9PLEO|nr:uncharacterized protein M421DRAFT_421400 [Didymella exigua CBS 183.55]KAF1927561.1 hypothetical protein M421DRAFT_421400 [Didymella exigua CBS 183.55]